ncbi:MAG: divalent-cation tolerance protein CutA [Candidatus Aminicenantaceae bacterium]|jgi:periplasmic divalent cation tolerance protein
MSGYIVVLSTVPDIATGRKIARGILEERLAACVNISGPLESLYWWEGKIQQDQEHLLVIKTRTELFPRLEEAVQGLHPYDVPEIIALPIEQGSSSYLEWIESETQNENR